MDKDLPKPEATVPVKEDPVRNRGIIAGAAIVLIIAIVVIVSLFGTAGTAGTQPCDEQSGTCSVPTTPATPTPVPPVKTERPNVELYVMAFCPYGVQMERVLIPVVPLLGDSIDLRVRYIASATGDKVETARSLHGNAEAVEDIRQMCIMQHAPDRYWDYLNAFNARCYPVWNNATALAACQQNVTAALGIPADTISDCTYNGEGLQLLKTDAEQVRKNKATSSPTLLINGQKFTGSRTPENVKQAICSHYVTALEACGTVLSSQAGSASGSC